MVKNMSKSKSNKKIFYENLKRINETLEKKYRYLEDKSNKESALG
jgi:hypothetical protein